MATIFLRKFLRFLIQTPNSKDIVNILFHEIDELKVISLLTTLSPRLRESFIENHNEDAEENEFHDAHVTERDDTLEDWVLVMLIHQVGFTQKHLQQGFHGNNDARKLGIVGMKQGVVQKCESCKDDGENKGIVQQFRSSVRQRERK